MTRNHSSRKPPKNQQGDQSGLPEFQIVDESHDRRYFTLVPILIDDLDLSPFAVRLYLRIKRRAGERGICFESTRNLATGCQMAMATVSKAKQELIRAGLITIRTIPGKEGEFSHHEIKIVDVWKTNVERYATCSPGEQVDNSAHSLDEQDRSLDEQDRSPGELKKNPIKKIPLKKNNNSAALPLKAPPLQAPSTGSEYFDETQLPKLTEEQRIFLATVMAIFAPRRFKYYASVKKLLDLRDAYPDRNIIEALEWAASKDMVPGEAVQKAAKALPAWGSTKAQIKTGNGNGNGHKPAEAAPPDLQKVNARVDDFLKRKAVQQKGGQNG